MIHLVAYVTECWCAFPLNLCVDIKAVWRININKRASGEIFRRKKPEMHFSIIIV